MGRVDQQDGGAPSTRKPRLRGQGPRMRQVVVAAGIIGAVAAPLGMAATGANLREGVRNGTATKETEIISSNAASTGLKGGYSTRQSNLSSSGGGAIYGCRSGAGTSASTPPQNPCLRANNLNKGLAFEFNATSGNLVGTITASGNGGDQVKPFTTNATGVATGLNADRVDGQNAADIQKAATDAAAADATTKANAAKERFALVNEAGQIVEQSGGFTVVSTAGNNVYLGAGASLANHGLTATVAATNPLGSSTGEVAVARCGTPAVTCVPDGTNNESTLVVHTADSSGTAAPRRFYVTVTP